MKSGAFLYLKDLGEFMEKDEEPDMGGMINHQLDVTNLYKSTVRDAWKEGSKSVNVNNYLFDDAKKNGLSSDFVLQLQIDAAKKSCKKPKKDEKPEALPGIENESQYVALFESYYLPFKGTISAGRYLAMIDAGKRIGLTSEKILEIEHNITAKERILDSLSYK